MPFSRRMHPAIVVLALASLAHACAPTLAGQLATAKGEPIQSDIARVNIAPLSNQASGATKPLILHVDRDGSFATDAKLTPGDYIVEALVPGYAIATSRVSIGSEKTKPIKLTLSPLDPTRTKAASANLDAMSGRGTGGATLTPPSF